MKENIESICQWCSITIEFFLKKEPGFVFMRDLEKTLSSLKMNKNLKGLKALKKEIESEFISELSEIDRTELAALLNGELLSSDISSEIKGIVERGHIVSDDEYIMLTDYVGSADAANIEAVNQMLIEYYNKK